MPAMTAGLAKAAKRPVGDGKQACFRLFPHVSAIDSR